MVDGILGIVVVVFPLLEDSRSSIKLELDLSSQSALEVDDPQGFFFTNGNGFNLKLYIRTFQHNYSHSLFSIHVTKTYLARNKFDLEGFLEVFLINDANFLSGVDFRVFLHNIFVELLTLGGKQLYFEHKMEN